MAAFGQSLWSAESSKTTGQGTSRKRYAIVGVGSRHQMYQDAIERDYRDHAELVGICDTNPGRLEEARKRSTRNSATPPAAFSAEQFDEMLSKTKPDYVIVTTVDATHDDYIVPADPGRESEVRAAAKSHV
jgi:predicted dehydrogenase